MTHQTTKNPKLLINDSKGRRLAERWDGEPPHPINPSGAKNERI